MVVKLFAGAQAPGTSHLRDYTREEPGAIPFQQPPTPQLGWGFMSSSSGHAGVLAGCPCMRLVNVVTATEFMWAMALCPTDTV